MKSVLYRKRREKLPPLPRSVKDSNFDGEWFKTHNGDDFMVGSRDDPLRMWNVYSLDGPRH